MSHQLQCPSINFLNSWPCLKFRFLFIFAIIPLQPLIFCLENCKSHFTELSTINSNPTHPTCLTYHLLGSFKNKNLVISISSLEPRFQIKTPALSIQTKTLTTVCKICMFSRLTPCSGLLLLPQMSKGAFSHVNSSANPSHPFPDWLYPPLKSIGEMPLKLPWYCASPPCSTY